MAKGYWLSPVGADSRSIRHQPCDDPFSGYVGSILMRAAECSVIGLSCCGFDFDSQTVSRA